MVAARGTPAEVKELLAVHGAAISLVGQMDIAAESSGRPREMVQRLISATAAVCDGWTEGLRQAVNDVSAPTVVRLRVLARLHARLEACVMDGARRPPVDSLIADSRFALSELQMLHQQLGLGTDRHRPERSHLRRHSH